MCFKLSNLTIVSLDLLVAAYPILLMMITYWLVQLYGRNDPLVTSLWNRIKNLFIFFQMKLDIKTSTIDAFATFMLLSNEKFLSVSFDLLMPKRVFHLTQTATTLDILGAFFTTVLSPTLEKSIYLLVF